MDEDLDATPTGARTIESHIPGGGMVIDYVLVVKYLDPEDAEPTLITMRSAGMTQWEAIGCHTIALDDLRAVSQEGREEL